MHKLDDEDVPGDLYDEMFALLEWGTQALVAVAGLLLVVVGCYNLSEYQPNRGYAPTAKTADWESPAKESLALIVPRRNGAHPTNSLPRHDLQNLLPAPVSA